MQAEIIAHTTERDAQDVDGATWHKEWRVRRLSEAEQAEAASRYGFARSYLFVLEARRVDTPERPGAEWADWRACEYGASPDKVCTSFGDSTFEAAESLAPVHARMVADKRRRLGLWRAVTALRDWQGKGSAYMLGLEAKVAYETALRRARLWKLVQTDSAPQDKVDAIRAKVKAEWIPRIKAREAEEAKVRDTVARLVARYGF